MALEVQIAALTEHLVTKEVVDHPNHFGTLFVDGQGIEVGDFHVRRRAHRVGHGAGILGKLCCAQQRGILYSFHSRRSHIGRELGIPEHRKTLFQAQLKPVAAGYPVAGPVMEVFVGDDGLDTLEGGVRGSLLTGQHTGRVENIQPFVFHGAHVEVVHRHDHEDIQVVLPPVDIFVPAHGTLEGIHREITLLRVAGLDIHAQINVAAGTGGEGIFFLHQVSGYQGKEVSRLGERVFPGDKMATVFQLAVIHRVTIGKQHGIGAFVCLDTGTEARHDIRPVRIEGNAAKSFRLALSAEHTGGLVQTFQPGVVLRFDPGDYLQLEFFRHRGHDQRIATVFELTGAQRRAIQGNRFQLQTITVQKQRGSALRGIRVAAHSQGTVHTGAVFK